MLNDGEGHKHESISYGEFDLIFVRLYDCMNHKLDLILGMSHKCVLWNWKSHSETIFFVQMNVVLHTFSDINDFQFFLKNY